MIYKDKWGIRWEYIPGGGKGRSWVGRLPGGGTIYGQALHIEPIPSDLVDRLHRVKECRQITFQDLGREMVEAYLKTVEEE